MSACFSIGANGSPAMRCPDQVRRSRWPGISSRHRLATAAVASAATQITGASVSGVMVHMRRGGVDMKMGGVMIAGGLLGSFVGAALFRVLQAIGKIDVVIGLLYVLILGSIGALMLKDS